MRPLSSLVRIRTLCRWAVWLQAHWERTHETLLWARTEDGRLLGRRSRIGSLALTGPAAGYVRPVVRGAARR
jgi:hypothetical protein